MDGSCAPVGPNAPALADAFATTSEGWGFTAIAGSSCTNGEMPQLGVASCAAVDPCSAPFPPAGVAAVVSTTMTGEHVFATIDDAVPAVHSGESIALDEGTYPSLSYSFSGSITFIGRCAKTTIIGDGTHNALYVHGDTDIHVSNVTLSSSSSPIAVASGQVEADNVIVQNANVAIAAIGTSASITFHNSLIVGLGSDSLGGMAGEGGKITVTDSAIRGVTIGLLSTDSGSKIDVQRSVIDVVDSDTSSGIEATAKATLTAENVLVRSTAARLVAVYSEDGLTGTTPSPGTMTITSSVLEQVGAELTDATAVDVSGGGALTLTDVTLRHQSPIGINVDDGKVTIERVAILGETTTAPSRYAIDVGPGTVTADALAIPWAQGVGVIVGQGADFSMTSSLIEGVVARDPNGQEAILVSQGQAEIASSEIANNEQIGIVAIGGATVTITDTLIHDNLASDGSSAYGAVILHSSASIQGGVFARNDEGIAAGSGVVIIGTDFFTHQIALRAMAGMQLAQGSSDLAENTLSYDTCQFWNDGSETSTDTLASLDAAPFPMMTFTKPTSGPAGQ
jgi:hypothetical protein